MKKHITRRAMLSTGVVSAGFLLGSGCGGGAEVPRSEKSETGPGREPFWGPGPDKNLARDLTPGSTTVRLAGYLGYNEATPIGESVRAVREKGMTACIATADQWHDMPDSTVRELRAALDQHDVVIFEVGGYRNMLHTDETMRQEYLKRLAYCLESAERIGCKMVGTISGSRNPDGNEFVDNYMVHPDNWTLETWNILIASIKQVLKDTEGMQAALGMEAQVTTNLDGPLAHERLMIDVGSERVKVNLDPTNMVHLYNHFHTTALINECFDRLGENIFGCHAKDTFVLPHSQTVHVQEVCPGRGNLDYETYFVRLSHMKWSRALLPEHIPADQFDEAYAYLRTVAAKVGVKIHGDA